MATTIADIDAFTRAYVECALWTSYDESDDSGGRPLDENYGLEDVAPEALASIAEDCAVFQADNADLIGEESSRAGCDFWLTRNRHGTGFWDGDWMDGVGLTDAAHAYGESYLFVGNDGKIYVS